MGDDDEIRDVAWQEFDKERERERYWRPGSLPSWFPFWRWRIPKPLPPQDDEE